MPQGIKQAEICVLPNSVIVFDLGSLLSLVVQQVVRAENETGIRSFPWFIVVCYREIFITYLTGRIQLMRKIF